MCIYFHVIAAIRVKVFFNVHMCRNFIYNIYGICTHFIIETLAFSLFSNYLNFYNYIIHMYVVFVHFKNILCLPFLSHFCLFPLHSFPELLHPEKWHLWTVIMYFSGQQQIWTRRFYTVYNIEWQKGILQETLLINSPIIQTVLII